VPKENDDKNTKLNAVKVGIGTATPQSNLHVVGTTTLQGQTNVKGKLFADSINSPLITADSLRTNSLNVEGNARIKGFLTVDSMRVPGTLHVGKNSLILIGGAIDPSLPSNPNPAFDAIAATSQILSLNSGVDASGISIKLGPVGIDTGNGNVGVTTEDRALNVGINTEKPKAVLHVYQKWGNHSILPQDTVTALFTNGNNYNNKNGFEVGILPNNDAVLNQRQNLPMLFYTNNLERMRIVNSGNVGIRTTSPRSALEINSDTLHKSGLQFTQFNSSSTATANNGKVLSVDAAGKVILVKEGTGIGTGDVKACGTAANNFLTKWTDATNKTICNSIVYDDGAKVGIGTTAPRVGYKLHVSEGSTLITGTNGRDVTFAAESDNAAGNGLFSTLYLSAVSSGPNRTIPEAQIRFNGQLKFYNQTFQTRFEINDVGNFGFGMTASPITKISVNGDSRFFGKVTITVPSLTDGLVVNGDVRISGRAFCTASLWSSDQLFKTNINGLNNVLTTIQQLKPKSFYFDTTNIYGLNFSNKKQYGFIAQDVETILPELVELTTKPADLDSLGNVIHPEITYKSLNYNAFIGILTKGMQEQNTIIENLQEKLSKQDSINTALQSQLSKLLAVTTSAALYKTDANNISPITVELNNAQAIILDQNSPNPFKESSVITYFIPDVAQNVKIIFYDNIGKIIKSVDIQERGNGVLQVYASNLSSGIYTYSIIADGKVVDTKKMMVTK